MGDIHIFQKLFDNQPQKHKHALDHCIKRFSNHKLVSDQERKVSCGWFPTSQNKKRLQVECSDTLLFLYIFLFPFLFQGASNIREEGMTTYVPAYVLFPSSIHHLKITVVLYMHRVSAFIII